MGWNVIVESSRLVPGKYKSGILPGLTLHQRVDKSRNIACSYLHASTRRIDRLKGVLIPPGAVSRLDHGYLWQGSIGRVSRELRGGHEVLRELIGEGEHGHRAPLDQRGVWVTYIN